MQLIPIQFQGLKIRGAYGGRSYPYDMADKPMIDIATESVKTLRKRANAMGRSIGDMGGCTSHVVSNSRFVPDRAKQKHQ